MPKKFKVRESDKGLVIRDDKDRRVAFVRGKGVKSRTKANVIRDTLLRGAS